VDQDAFTAATESALVSRLRLGEHEAFDVIVARHQGAVARVARLIAPEDRRRSLVEDTFHVAEAALRQLVGPTESLRPFLLMTACRLRSWHPPVPVAARRVVSEVPFREPQAGAMHPAVSIEFSYLPEAWQLLLWHLEVESDSPEYAAALVGVSPVVVPALVQGARGALRRALLMGHRTRRLPAQCMGHALRLERHTGARPPRAVLRHSAECQRCAALLGDLDAVERDLGDVLARQLLGWAAEGYLSARRVSASGDARGSRIVGC
jgi:hypothetical protein